MPTASLQTQHLPGDGVVNNTMIPAEITDGFPYEMPTQSYVPITEKHPHIPSALLGAIGVVDILMVAATWAYASRDTANNAYAFGLLLGSVVGLFSLAVLSVLKFRSPL